MGCLVVKQYYFITACSDLFIKGTSNNLAANDWLTIAYVTDTSTLHLSTHLKLTQVKHSPIIRLIRAFLFIGFQKIIHFPFLTIHLKNTPHPIVIRHLPFSHGQPEINSPFLLRLGAYIVQVGA